MEWHGVLWGQGQVGVGEGSALEGGGHWNSCLGQWAWPRAAGNMIVLLDVGFGFWVVLYRVKTHAQVHSSLVVSIPRQTQSLELLIPKQ